MSIFKQYMLSLRSLMILVEQKGGGIAEKKYITCIVGISNLELCCPLVGVFLIYASTSLKH